MSEVDANGNPGRVTSAQGSYVHYIWEYPTIAPKGRVTQIQEFSNTGVSEPASTITYYGAEDPDGREGLVKTLVFQGSDTTTYTYTSLGNVKTVTQTGLGTTTFGYVQDQTGATKPERYGLPYSVKPGSTTGSVVDTLWFNYDSRGRVTGSTDASGQASSFTWNDYNQIISAAGPGGYGITTTRPVIGKSATSLQLTKTGSTTATLFENTYDAEAAMATTKDGSNSSSGPKIESPTFDSQYGLRALVNGNGQETHAFTPNPVQRLLDVRLGTGSRSLSQSIRYDRNGNLLSVSGQEDGRSYQLFRNFLTSLVNTVSYSMQSATGPNGTAGLTFTYDTFGRILSAFANSSTSQGSTVEDLGTKHDYTYNDDDQVATDQVTNEVRGGTQGIGHVYNPNGSRQSMTVDVRDAFGAEPATYPKVQYDYAYDTVGRVIDISAYYKTSSGSLITPAVARAAYAYDANGRILAVRTLKSTTLYEYSAAGQVVKLTNATKDGFVDPYAPSEYNFTDPHNTSAHTKLSEFTGMTYNARGKITGMSFESATALGTPSAVTSYGSGSATLAYDGGGRLTSEVWTGGENPITLTHEYDNADNLKKLRGVNWTMDLGSDQVTGSALTGYTAPTYNSSGEINSINDFQFLYTARAQLGLVTGKSLDGGAFANNDADLRYNYDADGLRTYQTQTFGTGNANSNEQTYLYDGAALVCRWVGLWLQSGTHNFANAVSDLGNIAAPDAFVLYLWGPTGAVMEFDMQGNSKAFLCDPLGNVVNTTTADGRAEKPLFYDGYGLPVWPDEANSQRVRRQPFQYKGQTGYYADAHTGLYYCHNRYYDPRMGRWLSRDPIGLEGGVNVYSYCAGDPVNLVDPDGLQTDTFRSFMNGYFSPTGDQWAFWKSLDKAAMENDAWIYTDYYRLHRHAATGNAWGAFGVATSLAFNVALVGDGAAFMSGPTSLGRVGLSARTAVARIKLTSLAKRASKKAELTLAQKQAIANKPSLQPMFLGERIDTLVKGWADRDWILRLLKVNSTPRFTFGPDFRLRGTDVWLDITTAPQWSRHVSKYGPVGYRIRY